MTARNATVSRKREMVSLLGKFIFLRCNSSLDCSGCGGKLPVSGCKLAGVLTWTLERLGNQIVIGVAHDSDPGKLPGRQFASDVNTSVDIGRVRLAAGDDTPSFEF